MSNIYAIFEGVDALKTAAPASATEDDLADDDVEEEEEEVVAEEEDVEKVNESEVATEVKKSDPIGPW